MTRRNGNALIGLLATCLFFVAAVSQAVAAVPTATTRTATGVTETAATLNGSVTTDSPLSDCHFEFVPIATYRATRFNDLSAGGSAPCAPAAGSVPLNTATPVSATITPPPSVVVFRLVATNGSGTGTGLPVGTEFGITEADGLARQLNGQTMTQAGGHPFRASTLFGVTEATAADDERLPVDSFKDVIVDLPPGLVGNPNVVPTCTEAELGGGGKGVGACPVDSQVGLLHIYPYNVKAYVPLYNMEAPEGEAALFGFNYVGALYHFSGNLARDEAVAGKYHVRVESLNTPQTLPIRKVNTEVWGIPADPNLDDERGVHPGGDAGGIDSEGNKTGGASCANPGQVQSGRTCEFSSSQPRKPFFTLPTSCTGPARVDLRLTGWQGAEDNASFLSHDLSGSPVGNDGCGALEFSPTLQARPTTNVADSPSGLDVSLHIPQNEDPDGTSAAHLKDTTVVLPEGLSVNPSAANGLDACSPGQVALQSDTPASCPDAAKLGTVTVETPLLDHPVEGGVYIATPYDNPFGSLLALYIALDDPESGTVVKIAGKVTPDPVTGQLTATFDENPQVPFEDFRLRFFGGAGGSLKTPATCGTYTTQSSLTPWSAPDSGPPDTPSDTWAIEQGPGGSCATEASKLPNAVSFDAGTVSPIAGAESPMVINLRRQDGTQQFRSLTLTPPQGLVARLAGIPYCSEQALSAAAQKTGRAEEASPSCSQASYLGTATAAAGAGPTPYYAPGKAYLTGPYKGAPLSIAIVTPATAGPFDLGTIVVRSAIYVDKRTAQITAVSDEIPSILRGIPLDVRAVQVKLDRAGWGINPTSCEPSAFGGQLMSLLGQATPLQSRFQVGECGRLGFKPKLTLSLKGAVKRNGYPALTAVLKMPPGGANLASVSVALPHSEFLAQEHIRTICTRVQFAAKQCPEAAIYGQAAVTTPLLDQPLAGPVYLRSSSNKLPDLVPHLLGPPTQPIELESAGRTDSINGGIRNTFDFVPDAPFSKLVLRMQGGKKGLLVNSTNICAKPKRATVKYTAHNGRTYEERPVLRVKCPKKAKKKNGKRGGR